MTVSDHLCSVRLENRSDFIRRTIGRKIADKQLLNLNLRKLNVEAASHEGCSVEFPKRGENRVLLIQSFSAKPCRETFECSLKC